MSFPQPSVSGTDPVHMALELKIRNTIAKLKERGKIVNIVFSLTCAHIYVCVCVCIYSWELD